MKEPDGSYKSTFEHGTITWKEGDEKATVHDELAAPRAPRKAGQSSDCPALFFHEVRGQCRIRRRRSVVW